MKPAWHLLTGELSRGGIGDYTRLLAEALAGAGRDVHVWSPDADGVVLRGVHVHPMRGFGADALREAGKVLDGYAAPRRLLVQYAPQAWGMRGMNVGLGRWLRARRRAGDDVRVMFHEPFFPFGWQRPRRNLLAAVNRWMARDLLRASTQAYVSTDAWERLLRPLAPPGLPVATLPIPSTIPFVNRPDLVAPLRAALSEGGRRPVFVHFGTYGGMIAPMLAEALGGLMERRPDARILLLGSGGPAFAARLRSADPRFDGSIVAPGFQSAEDVSIHLQSADVALQPYPDGADTRRTSLMACWANGVPTVTTMGRFTPFEWLEEPAGVVSGAPGEMVPVALQLLSADRAAQAVELRAFYKRSFAVKWTVLALRKADGGG